MRLFRTKSPAPNPIHKWNDDKEFCELVNEIRTHTLVDVVRCYMLYQFLKQVSAIEGDIAEIGVYKGGTARLISKTAAKTDKTVHLFDTFSGMPPTDPEKDVHKEKDFNDTSFESVKFFLKDCDNLKFYPGFFPETAAPVKDKSFSFVHVDVDIYKSVKDCSDFFYTRTTRGGVIVYDDYGFVSCPGALKGVDEFYTDKAETPIYLPTGQAFVVKL